MGILNFFGKKNINASNKVGELELFQDNDVNINTVTKESNPKDIYSIDYESPQERSAAFLEHHLKNISGFEKMEYTKEDDVLSPSEMAFLKYLDGKTPEQIAGYWTHSVGLKINKDIRKFIDHGYLNYSIILEKSLRVVD